MDENVYLVYFNSMNALRLYISSIVSDRNIEFIPIGRGANNQIYKFFIQGMAYALKIKERGIHDFFEPEAAALKILNGFYAPKLILYENGTSQSTYSYRHQHSR